MSAGKLVKARQYLPTDPEQRKPLLDSVMNRYQHGESMYALAAELNVHPVTLYRAVLQDYEQVWKDAKVAHALADLEDAENEQRTAQDAITLTRARDRVKTCQWHAERLLRRVYGQDVPADLAGRINIVINTAQATVEPVQVIDSKD